MCDGGAQTKGGGGSEGCFHVCAHTYADVQLFGHACSNTHRHTAAVFMQLGLVSRESY